MRKNRKLPLLLTLCLLASVLLMTGTAKAAEVSALDVSVNYNEEEKLLTVTCDLSEQEGSTELTRRQVNDALTAKGIDSNADIQTISVTGNMETIGGSAFSNSVFTNAEILSIGAPDLISIGSSAFNGCRGLKCVVIDAPGLTGVDGSAFSNCRQVTRLFYVGSEEYDAEFVDSISFGSASSPKRVYLDSTEELCEVTIGECENGTIITDAAPLEKMGDTVLVSVIPEAGYQCSIIYDHDPMDDPGDEPVTELTHTWTIQREAVVFSAKCTKVTKKTIESGTFGAKGHEADVAWILYEDGELFITGLGEIMQKGTSGYPWYSYADQITKVIIDDGITNIPANAFGHKNYSKLKTVTIGKDVNTIGDNAFLNCPVLEEAEFMGPPPETLGSNIFPATDSRIKVSDIATNANTFQIVYQEDNQLFWGDFDEAKGWHISALREETNNLQKDENKKKYYLAHIKFNDEEEMVVTDFSSLNKGPDTEEYKGVYYNKQGIPFTLYEESKTASVGTETSTYVLDMGYLKSNHGVATIPETVTTYDDDGKPLQSYTVTAILQNAFTCNRFLEKVEIPATVRDIKPGAFYDCPRFTEFEVKKDENTGEPSKSFVVKDGILYDSIMDELYVVPTAKDFSTYKDNTFTTEQVKNIGIGAFHGCTGGDSGSFNVIIPDNVRVIRNEAFIGATGLHHLNVKGGVEVIGDRVFNNCSKLHTLFIYDGVQSIGTTPLKGCNSLERLTLPFLGTSRDKNGALTLPKLFDLSASRFTETNSRLAKVMVAKGVLRNSAFADCANLKEIVLGSDITELPNQCFDNCTALEYLDLGPSYTLDLTALEEDLKKPNANVQYEIASGVVPIRAHIDKIGDYAFRGCAAFKEFHVNEYNNPNYANDEWNALYDKEFKTMLCYPPNAQYQYYCVMEQTETIFHYAFYNCNKLITINIPGNKELGVDTSAFADSVFPGPYLSTPVPYPVKIYVHRNSNAQNDFQRQNVWIIEDLDAESIQIQRPSDRLAFDTSIDMKTAFIGTNLYFIAVHPGGTVLLAQSNCEMSFPSTDAGKQTVTATFTGKDDKKLTTSFDVYLFEKQDNHSVIEFDPVGRYDEIQPLIENEGKDNQTETKDHEGFAAFYNADGQMISVAEAASIDYEASNNILHLAVYAPNDIQEESVAQAKLFFLDKDGKPFMDALDIRDQFFAARTN